LIFGGVSYTITFNPFPFPVKEFFRTEGLYFLCPGSAGDKTVEEFS